MRAQVFAHADKQDLSQADSPRQWVAAIYFITMTITTVRICLAHTL